MLSRRVHILQSGIRSSQGPWRRGCRPAVRQLFGHAEGLRVSYTIPFRYIVAAGLLGCEKLEYMRLLFRELQATTSYLDRRSQVYVYVCTLISLYHYLPPFSHHISHLPQLIVNSLTVPAVLFNACPHYLPSLHYPPSVPYHLMHLI